MKYIVESLEKNQNGADFWENLAYDIIEADNPKEAVEFYRDYINEHGGTTADIYNYRVKEYGNDLDELIFTNTDFED